jgi:hypothetical protein
MLVLVGFDTRTGAGAAMWCDIAGAPTYSVPGGCE